MAFTYKGLTAKLEKHTVTTEEVEKQLQVMVQQTPKITEITGRSAQNGDEVVLDYAGFCDGEQFAGGTAQKQTLTLGSGAFIPGFEQQLIGANIGDDVSVKVTFPQQYHAENLAGKEAEFKCHIHAIREKSSWELGDEFAKAVAGMDTLEQLRTELMTNMQTYADRQAEMELQDDLLRLAADTLDVKFTDDQIEKAVDEQLSAMNAQLSGQGLSLEVYCSFMGKTMDQLRQEARGDAEAALRSQAAIDRIVLLEALIVEPYEFDEALAIIARQNRITVDQLQGYRNSNFDQAVRNGVLQGKVMQLIRASAVITE
jgi:trigger factor